jgi:hypothetical protein
MDDLWEVQVGLDPWFNDTAEDPDSDKLTNWEEYTCTKDVNGALKSWSHYTYPLITDSDNDGIKDGDELLHMFPYKKKYSWDYYTSSGAEDVIPGSSGTEFAPESNATYKFMVSPTNGNKTRYYLKFTAVTNYPTGVTLSSFLHNITVKVGSSTPPSNQLTLTISTDGFYTSTFDTNSTCFYVELANENITYYLSLLSITVYRQGGLEPFDSDTDDDELIDGDEISKDNGYITFPDNQDTDGDFLRDGFEVDMGLDPNPEYTSKINTVLLNPYESGADNTALAEKEVSNFHKENFVIILMFVKATPANGPTYSDGSPMLEPGFNEFIIPFGVFYECRFYEDSQGNYEHLQSQHFNDSAKNVTFYEYATNYSMTKIAHISFAMNPDNAAEFVSNYLLEDSNGAQIAQGSDIRYDIGRMFDTEDSPQLLRAISPVTPTKEELESVDGIELQMFELMYQRLTEANYTLLDDGNGTSLMEDNDTDGLSAWGEASYNLSDNSSDADEDGLLDGDEVCVHFSNPITKDSDGDGMWDGDEIDPSLDLDPISGVPSAFDSDPTLFDSDGDGINDSDEVTVYTVDNPNEREYDIWQTDPMKADTDGDTIFDNDEKFKRVFELDNNYRLKDDGTESVSLSGVAGNYSLLISVFVNVGINHANPKNLSLNIYVKYDSVTIPIENPYHEDSNVIGVSLSGLK